MDFLGLKTLSQLKEAVENIRDSLGIELDVDNIDINDPATFRLYQDGRTIGTFQFESAGMQKYLRELQPTVFEDLIAMNALYRPGPMEYIPLFINRKSGREPITYDIPDQEQYLKETYGITVYQEQVMLLSRLLADFTRGESDTLRKAMGKKQKDKLDELKPKFIKQGTAKGHPKDKLEKIWNDWEKFESYAFNMKATVEDEKLQGKINDEDKQKILDKCNEIINWLDKNQTAEKEEFEHQQKELEKFYNPIITKLYQSTGGMSGGMAGGMPGGFPGGGAPPSGGASSGPTIEEVD